MTAEDTRVLEAQLAAARWWHSRARAKCLALTRAGATMEAVEFWQERAGVHGLEIERLESLLDAGSPRVVQYDDSEIPW